MPTACVERSRPSAMAGALVPFREMAGIASSTLMFIQMAVSSGYNVVYSMLFEPGVVTLAIGMFVPITLGLVVAAFVGSRARRVMREEGERALETAAAG